MKSHPILPTITYLALFILAASFSTGTAHGGDTDSLRQWDNLKNLKPGQEISVVMNNMDSHHGQFESLSDIGLKLRQRTQEFTLARRDILRVSQKTGQGHQVRNALIGAAIGAGAGLAAGAAANNHVWNSANCTEGSNFGCAGPPHPHWEILLTPLGALGGAAIGGAITKSGWQEIYRAR